jgi:hypothetical protein
MMLAELKRTCIGNAVLVGLDRDNGIALATARVTVCKGESCRMLSKTIGKLTDMVPSVRGMASFILELRRTAARYTEK